MTILHKFFKFQGAGNDFVLFDQSLSAPPLVQISFLCDRNQGIGADGVVFVKPSSDREIDAEMVYYNADGKQVSFCGNGFRCLIAYLADKKQRGGENPDGEYKILCGKKILRARYVQGMIHTYFPLPRYLHKGLSLEGKTLDVVEIGVPHALLFMRQEEEIEVNFWGKVFRHHDFFAPQGLNVNFIWIEGRNAIRVRTFERGVEGETLSCASGTAAAVCMAYSRGLLDRGVRALRGGDILFEIEISGNRESGVEEIALIGRAKKVFEGVISESFYA